MASQPLRLILIALLAAAALSVASARPCKTFLISSYSFSVRRLPQPSGVGFVAVLTEVTHSDSRPLILIDDSFNDDADQFASSSAITTSPSSWPYDLNSLRDRTKDILSVVVALLFGGGCGALTAATLYLAWSLFNSPRHGDDDYDGSSSSDDEFSPKKVGYVKIPAVEDDASAKKAAVV